MFRLLDYSTHLKGNTMTYPTSPSPSHAPGECPDSYGNSRPLCNGVQTYGPNPFSEEIYGDSTNYWMCDGERYGAAMDI